MWWSASDVIPRYSCSWYKKGNKKWQPVIHDSFCSAKMMSLPFFFTTESCCEPFYSSSFFSLFSSSPLSPSSATYSADTPSYCHSFFTTCCFSSPHTLLLPWQLNKTLLINIFIRHLQVLPNTNQDTSNKTMSICAFRKGSTLTPFLHHHQLLGMNTFPIHLIIHLASATAVVLLVLHP